MDSINKLFDAGSITASQKKEMLNQVELNRGAAIKALSAKAKEKIKNSINRATLKGKIIDCEKVYLKSIKEILSAEQYEKWIKCHKEKYKKK
jgi:predicted lipoprotein